MSVRIRLKYSKRGGACFVPHIALAQVFSRSATRAGLKMEMTQGFSPRPKISFAPELPAGVVALNELVDIYFEDVPGNLKELLNNSLPDGFKVNEIIYPLENSVSLGKICKQALYYSKCENKQAHDLKMQAENYFNDQILKIKLNAENWLIFVVSNPAQNSIGGWIKNMIANDFIKGWHEINLVRAAIGSSVNFYD